MADLVIGHDAPLLLAHDAVLFLLADQDLLDSFEEVLLADILAVGLDRVDGGFIDHIGQVGTHSSARGQSDLLQIHRFIHFDIFRVDLEDGDASLEVRPVDDDAPVKAAGAQQGLVQDLGPVGGPDDQDTLGGLKAVHLREQLVESLLPLLVAPSIPGVTASADGVDLIDKNDAGRILIGFLEQITHSGSAHADIELDEIRACQGKEGHMRLSGDSLGEQGLACSGRPHKKGSLGKFCADLDIPAGIVQEIDDLDQRLLGLILSGDILEGDPGLLLDIFLGRALADAHNAAAAAHPLEQYAEQPPHQQDGEHIGQQKRDHHSGAVRHIRIVGDLGVHQALGQSVLRLRNTRVQDGIRILQVDLQAVRLHVDLGDLFLLDILDEFIVGDLAGLSVVPHEIADAGKKDHGQKQQEKQTLPRRLSVSVPVSVAAVSAAVAAVVASALAFSPVPAAIAAFSVSCPEQIPGVKQFEPPGYTGTPVFFHSFSHL